jgi:glycosyltransferase involved in cell wall biosynthesis
MKTGSVRVLPNAIDCEKFAFNPVRRDQIRKQLSLGNALTLIHVGNLRPEKNHKFLLQVFGEVLKIIPDARLLLVGEDYVDGLVQREAEKGGIIDSISFLGSCSNVSDLLQASDVFVFPSLYEGFPGAVLEAQANGLPCIISESITREIHVLPTTRDFPLSISPYKWALEIVNSKSQNRKEAAKLVAEAGYDISSYSSYMTNLYLQAFKKVAPHWTQ